MKSVYRFLKSPWLAVVTILVIAGLAIFATFPGALREDPRDFFRSAIFLAPVGVFTLNLLICAVDRFVGRILRHAPFRLGPDLVHLGLLVLIAAGLVTALGRQEKGLVLSAGDSAALDGSRTIQVISLQSRVYENGSPRAWTSTVRVVRAGQEEVASYPIEVNHPLRLPGIRIYQADWGADGVLRLADAKGGIVTPQRGDWLEQADTRWVYTRLEKSGDAWEAVFAHVRGTQVLESRALRVGDDIGPFTVQGIDAREYTGLRAVHDPGVLPFLAALVLAVAGLALTLVQRRQDARS